MTRTDKVVWICSHGQPYTEFELECGMTMAAMDAMMHEQELAFDLEHDQRREAELARCHTYGELDCPWPWYAEPPIEIVQPEIVEGPLPWE